MKPGRERPSPGRLALGFAALFPTVAAWVYFVVAAGSSWLAGAYAVCKVVQFGFPGAWLLWRRSGAVPAPGRRPAAGAPVRSGIAVGLATGLLLGGAVVAVYALVLRDSALMASVGPRIVERIRDMGVGTPVRYFLLAVFLSCVHSLLEEVYWRWFVFGGLGRHVTVRRALVLSSLAFAAHHVIVLDAFLGPAHRLLLTPLLALAVAGGGGVWAWQYARSGNLMGPWLSHLLVDVALMTIGWDVLVAGP